MPITKATASSIAPAAKGDLVVGSATNDASVLAVGTNTHVLTADSSTTTGLKWAAPSAPTAQAVAVDNGNPATDHTLTSGVYTTLLFNNELIDTDAFHSTTTNTGRLTVPTGLGGKYLLNFVGYVNPSTAGDFVAKFQINGNDKNRVSFKFGPSEPFSPSISSIVSLNAGDYVEILCYQNTGVNQLLSTNQYGQFAMFRIGA